MFHKYQTEVESVFVFETTQIGMVDDVLEAVSSSYDLQMYMSLTKKEHVNQYHLPELASKNLLKECASLGVGR